MGEILGEVADTRVGQYNEAARQSPPAVVLPPIDRVVPPVPTAPAPQ